MCWIDVKSKFEIFLSKSVNTLDQKQMHENKWEYAYVDDYINVGEYSNINIK